MMIIRRTKMMATRQPTKLEVLDSSVLGAVQRLVGNNVVVPEGTSNDIAMYGLHKQSYRTYNAILEKNPTFLRPLNSMSLCLELHY